MKCSGVKNFSDDLLYDAENVSGCLMKSMAGKGKILWCIMLMLACAFFVFVNAFLMIF